MWREGHMQRIFDLRMIIDAAGVRNFKWQRNTRCAQLTNPRAEIQCQFMDRMDPVSISNCS